MTEKIERSPSEEHDIRVQKVKDLRENGIEPWPEFKPVNANAHEVINEFQEGKESREYEVSGRIVSIRKHGKSIFCQSSGSFR